MEQAKKCPFFSVCAAYIIREKIEAVAVDKWKWSQRVCFGDFEKCVHFEIRNQNNQAVG